MAMGGLRLGRGALSAALGLAIGAMTVVPALAASSTVVVHPGDMKGWAFFSEAPISSGALVNGPATPPLGTGSANLTVDSTGRHNIGTLQFAGTRLDQITQLQYSTFRSAGSGPTAVALQFDVDSNLNDANEAYQGRLVFEPYLTPGNVVQSGTWQIWSPLDGMWWGSGSGPTRPISEACPQGDPCTWDEILAQFPHAGVHRTVTGNPATGVLLFRAGGPWDGGFVGNVDAFTIGVNGDTTTFDFEATAPVPSAKDDCKDGGWQTFKKTDGSSMFKNQGDCVSFVATGGKNKPNGR